MPEIYRGAYLIGYLQELGFSTNTGYGPTPLNFTEINAWQEATCLKLSPWEVLAIRKLSQDYIRQLGQAENPHEPAPYMSEDIEQKRASTDAFFRSLTKREPSNDRHRKPSRKGHR